MTLNPMKQLAADRILTKHGLPPKTEDPPMREYLSKEESAKVINSLCGNRRYRSKIDPENRSNWKLPKE